MPDLTMNGAPMVSPPSLTRTEAQERAALIEVHRYDIAVDLTAMVDGPEWRAVSTVHFSSRTPGATTFVDADVEVVEATLNGATLGADRIDAGRITLVDLQAENVLVVSSVQTGTTASDGVHRSVDVSDKEVYVWTSFEPDAARRAWACFDQPDLKAPHTFTVLAPAAWRVVSNSGDPVVTVVDGGSRRWEFPPTPPLSTYVPVVNAGPFYELRAERGGYDLGLLARQSLARYLDRDAEELFRLTEQGLAFFGDRFALPFPQRKYDQVFVPDLGGAMENYGCVTWSDGFIYRCAPTYAERELRCTILLHEMAHMWFGDIVTMAWWEDLWLNEAFAEWACTWAAATATEFTDAWSGFLASKKLRGYSADMAPTKHPIRQPVDDVAAAVASFDGITYRKGASVLKQLFAFVGEDACVAGLRSYFARYAWGNTSLADLMAELGKASGRDLSDWTTGWLDTAGTDRLTLHASTTDGAVVRVEGPDGGPARPHRLDIGVYDLAQDGSSLRRRALVPVETAGSQTPVSGLGDAAVLLVNDEDLTFASVRPDPSSVAVLLDAAPTLPAAVSRAVAVTTAWDMVVCGDLAAAEFVRCVTAVLAAERVDSVIEPYLALAVEAADLWSPADQRDELMAQVAQCCVGLLADPARRQVAARALAQTAVTDAQLAAVRELQDDLDLRWRLLIRLAEIGTVDPAEVTELAQLDPDPDTWVRELTIDAARPDPEAKERVWSAVVERRVPMGSLRELSLVFWRRSQADILAPYGDRYLELLPALHHSGMLPALGLSAALYPRVGADADFVARAEAAAATAEVSPAVAKTVIELTDRLRRMVATRALS